MNKTHKELEKLRNLAVNEIHQWTKFLKEVENRIKKAQKKSNIE